MRIFYWSKKSLPGLMAVGLIFICFLGFIVFQSGRGEMAVTQLKEPVYQGNTGTKVMAITVNVDWGEEYLPDMLEEFARHDCKVTFFVTGQWAEKNPELLKQMKEAGHSIQNHAYKHVHFNSLSQGEALSQIKKAEEVIYRITGERTRFFAPPYGEKNDSLMAVISDIDYELIMWSIDTIDWQKPSPETIIQRISNKAHNDAIILMHPTDSTLKALPGLFSYLNENEYKMVTIDQIIGVMDGKP